jgi:hypothetical protein
LSNLSRCSGGNSLDEAVDDLCIVLSIYPMFINPP